MKHLVLSKGMTTLVDDEDFNRVARYKWHAQMDGNTIYVARKVGYKSCGKWRTKHISLHRFILSAKPGTIIDHIDGNGLNNTRENLRFCTQSQNQQNARARHGSSRFKGVSYDKEKRKWRAQITYLGKRSYLGLFHSENAAADRYDNEAVRLFGNFAKLNKTLQS